MSQQPTPTPTPMSSVIDIPVAPAAQQAQALPPVPEAPGQRDQRARTQASARGRTEAAQAAPRSAFAPLLLAGLALLG